MYDKSKSDSYMFLNRWLSEIKLPDKGEERWKIKIKPLCVGFIKNLFIFLSLRYCSIMGINTKIYINFILNIWISVFFIEDEFWV